MAKAKQQTGDLVEVLAYDTFYAPTRVFLRAEFFATRDAIQRVFGLCAESTRRLVPRGEVDQAGFTSIKARRPVPGEITMGGPKGKGGRS